MNNSPAQDSRLKTQRIEMPAEFEDIFSHFYYALNDTDQPIDQKLMPTFQTIMVFSFGNQISMTSGPGQIVAIDRMIIISTIKKLLAYTLFPGAEMLVVNFKLDAVYRFFGDDLKADQEFIIHPGDLYDDDVFFDLWQKLKNLEAVDQKATAILNFSQLYLRERPAASEGLIAQTKSGDSLSSIKLIAHQNNQSVRTVQLNYKKFFGYTGKEINRYERFQKAVQLIGKSVAGNTPIDWFEIIDECGYYDQSQLIHDFNYYLELSPTQYLKQQQEICIPHPSEN